MLKILIIQNETLLFSFSDTPAIFPIPRRWRLKEPSFISEGKECIFEDGESIYLIDIKNKNIGEIVDGRDHVLINNNYLKKKYFLELTD